MISRFDDMKMRQRTNEIVWRPPVKNGTGLFATSPAALMPSRFGLFASIPGRVVDETENLLLTRFFN
jgi:hypothetical protein